MKSKSNDLKNFLDFLQSAYTDYKILDKQLETRLKAIKRVKPEVVLNKEEYLKKKKSEEDEEITKRIHKVFEQNGGITTEVITKREKKI